ncbi:MAG TPA: hypothetical protein VHU81_03095 [Thermoanaerobaculia bacterium]|jgi:hypothetical protein|nr:hypothetical protein [Thermoanaerobaculia bacterium]
MAEGASILTSVTLERGLEACRKGDWAIGLRYLGDVAQSGATLPGVFYSYLGYGIARYQNRVGEGLKLCQHSIKVEFYQPENYVNLARTYILSNDRSGAVKTIRSGLKIDPQNPELLELYRDLGIRQLPVLSFLSRSNPLNRFLGGVRHAIQGDPPEQKPAARPERRPDPKTAAKKP